MKRKRLQVDGPEMRLYIKKTIRIVRCGRDSDTCIQANIPSQASVHLSESVTSDTIFKLPPTGILRSIHTRIYMTPITMYNHNLKLEYYYSTEHYILRNEKKLLVTDHEFDFISFQVCHVIGMLVSLISCPRPLPSEVQIYHGRIVRYFAYILFQINTLGVRTYSMWSILLLCFYRF